MSITQTVCAFAALGIQYAMRMRHMITVALQYFAILSLTARFSEKKISENIMCVSIFSTTFV
jgi:hypothetical protein